MMLQRWLLRLRYQLNSGERERLLREEMEIHLDMKIQQLVEDGMPEPDARSAAHRQFGNLARQQEDSREMWIARWLSDLMQDAHYALRTVRKQPGFAAVAALSAALGIGACSMLFGLANHALFRPLPVEDSSRLVSITGKNPRKGKTGTSFSYPDFEDLRKATSLQGVTAFFQFLPATIAGNGDPQRYWGSLVTANYFEVVRPGFVIGRGFDSERDDVSGESPKVVLSYGLWASRYGADRGLVGRSIELNGQKVDVVGVTAPGFRGTEVMIYSDFWVPFSMLDSVLAAARTGERLHDRASQWLMATGRLRDGSSEKAAVAELEGIGASLRAAYPATNTDRAFHVERAGQVNPGARKMIVVFFAMLLGVAALVLCTACANVANLLLARASARQKEIATRLAIGAGRGRLIRQLLTESVMLALLGGIGGYALAHLGAAAIERFRIPLSMPVDLSISLDYRVLLFCIGLSTLTGILFGLVPAMRATRPDLAGALKEQRVRFGQSRRFGLRNVLVVAQIAICMVLLICSGLFLRSFYSAHQIDVGFTQRNVLMLAIDPSLNRYSSADTSRLINDIVAETSALPGVESVSVTSSVPLNLEGTHNAFAPEGQEPGEQNRMSADIYSITPGFFETLGVPFLEGEDFRAGAPAEDIVIVNRALAERAFPNQNPVGRRISYHGRTVRITGMVATTKSRTIGEDPRPCLYFPMARELRGNDSLTGMTLLMRTRGDPAGYAPLARQTIRGIDPALAVFEVRTMDAQLSRALFFPRIAALLFGLGGLMGVLISTIGIYGVVSFAVARRTQEIGVRMALGARREQVLGMVLRHGLTLTVAGSAIGLSLAAALSRVAASVLYGVSPTDAITFSVVPAFLLLVALAACLIPARRAASLDPIRALRYE